MTEADSFYDLWGVRHDDKITVTTKTGEKFFGRIGNADEALQNTQVRDLVLRLDPEYGRGTYHRVLASEIVAVSKTYP